jgi:hypothetical protein
MIKVKLWIGIILVFILGALAGSLGMGIYIQERSGRLMFDDSGDGPPPPPMMHFLIRRLDKDLDLTMAQKDEIEKIMTQTFENIHAIMQKKQPELEKLVEDSIELIKEKLDPEQREKLARLKIFERMKQRMDPKHPPGKPDFMGEHDVFDELKERLVLSNAQEADIRPVIDEAIERHRKIEEKYEELNRNNEYKMENEVNELQKNIETRVAVFLTEEQMKTFRQIQEELPPHHIGRATRPHGPHGFDGPFGPDKE